MLANAYLDGLKMLSRRELSEAQVRQRLARRGYDADAIDDAVRRLKEQRAIDDRRVAEAMARTETAVKGRGKLRVERQIEKIGIARATARHAIAEVFDQIDNDQLIEAALAKRLRPGALIRDDRELQRLYRYLVGQGFEPDQVMRTLEARSRRRS